MPPTPQPRTHYDTLGVSRNASQDEVKKRYRELARKHHPDVNPGDPNAARRFTEITAAYKVLSDASSRQTYDAELLLQEKRAANAQARARANDFPGTTTYYPPGGGTASPPPRPAQPRPQNPGSGAAGAANAQNVANEVSRLLQQAQAALVRMRFLEARDLAQQSLRLKRTAEGYEILGDVYRLQNRADDAMNMYTMSLQLDPRNQRVMDRLQRIARATSRSAPQPGGGGRPAPSGYEAPRPAGPAVRPGAVPPPGAPTYLRTDRRPLAGLLVAFMGYGAVALLLAYVALFGREAPVTPLTPVSLVSQWNGTLLWALPLVGVLLGLTMAVTGAIRRIDDELIFSPRPGGRRSAPQVPMGLVLLALSMVSFWAAALLHTIISALQEARLDALLKVFGAVAGVVLFVTAVYDPSRAQVFLFGGNVVFLAFAFGWFLGDIFRPEY